MAISPIETRSMSSVEAPRSVEEEISMDEKYGHSVFTDRKPEQTKYVNNPFVPAVIDRDIREENRVKAKWLGSITPTARHLELIVGRNCDGSTDEKWLGKNASTHETSDFDDIFNHIDMVVEWTDEGDGPIPLGIDVTTAIETGDAAAEKEKIAREYAESSKLFQVKYFRRTNENGDIVQGAIYVPRIIILIKGDTVDQYWDKQNNLLASISQIDEVITSLTKELEAEETTPLRKAQLNKDISTQKTIRRKKINEVDEYIKRENSRLQEEMFKQIKQGLKYLLAIARRQEAGYDFFNKKEEEQLPFLMTSQGQLRQDLIAINEEIASATLTDAEREFKKNRYRSLFNSPEKKANHEKYKSTIERVLERVNKEYYKRIEEERNGEEESTASKIKKTPRSKKKSGV